MIELPIKKGDWNAVQEEALDEWREFFFKRYEEKIAEWNKEMSHGVLNKKKELTLSFIEGEKMGAKFCADMLMHSLGMKSHHASTTITGTKEKKKSLPDDAMTERGWEHYEEALLSSLDE